MVKEMASDQTMMQDITQTAVEATKAAILVVRETESTSEYIGTTQPKPRISGPLWKQLTFECKTPDQYNKLCIFEIVVRNIFLTNSYSTQGSKKIPIEMNWLSCEGLKFILTLNDSEKEKWKTLAGLFQGLNAKFKLQQIETILSLQYYIW